MNTLAESRRRVTYQTAKKVICVSDVWTGKISPIAYIEMNNLWEIEDYNEIEEFCRNSLKKFPKQAEDVTRGKAKAIGAIVGSVLHESSGRIEASVIENVLTYLIRYENTY